MPDTLTTTITELPESRVRVQVRVAPEEIERRVEGKARELGHELKLPGFRRGKVPAPLVIQRVGREAVLEGAVRDTLGSWYVEALESSEIVPVGDPKIELGELPPRGERLEFSFEIGVLPKATLGRYRELEVGRAEPLVEEAQVDRELDGIRERLARLETVERPAAEGDFVVIDYTSALVAEANGEQPQGVGDQGEPARGGRGADAQSGAQDRPPAGGEERDRLLELGSGALIEGLEAGLVGASAGDTRTLALTLPDSREREELAGRDVSFEVTVKEVKRKQLPAVDDDLAVDTGFDALEDLRDDIRARLREAHERQIEEEFRTAALDAAVEQAQVQVPPALIEARAREMWERVVHALGHEGITRESYLQLTGRDEQEILAENAPTAERALRREAVLTAVVAAERIEPEEQELLEAVRPAAERAQEAPERLLTRLRDAGRLDEIREDLAARKAIDLIASTAVPIPLEQAHAREQLWTPEKERSERAREEQVAEAQEHTLEHGQGAGKLWTPDR
ncbi:MAG TPA: trigger factor [Solirubrobacteraceae bacterium]|jgi:trigger factor|nr:trigger factor [Solirubrobacteraceae bacterium]